MYLKREGILEYFSVGEKFEYEVFDLVDKNNKVPFVPEPEDLYRLHILVRQRRVFNILEFGLGFSTIVMADALMKNKKDFYENENRPTMRITEPFKLFSVDANQFWIDSFKTKYSDKIPHFGIIELTYSECIIGEYRGQICHYYRKVPNKVTDFIYLDGPGGSDVQGNIGGLDFNNCPERTVMGADLLRMESTFLPGTMIITDGRMNNVRFLKNNFQRRYVFESNAGEDISAFELSEQPLGKINKSQIDYSLGDDYYKRLFINN
jgi:hypothetical protein